MSSLRFEPVPRPTRFSCTPQGDGRAEDWIGRWTNGQHSSVVVYIAGLNVPSREYDVVVREKLCSIPASLLRHTFVQIYESRCAASSFPLPPNHQPPPGSTPSSMELLRTLLLPEHGILLALYQFVPEHPSQWSPPCRVVRYRRPTTERAAEVDLFLRQTPRVS